MLTIEDHHRVRTIALNRPDALNAFNEAMYQAFCDALLDAAADDAVAVVLLTGTGRAFCAGTDLQELLQRDRSVPFTEGARGFARLMSVLPDFSKPLVCAVNGVGIGLGTTLLGYADLVFMASDARLKCPFTSLGIAPEAASTYLLPQLVGRQHAAWILLSSDWIDADEALRIGLAWKVCEPKELIATATSYAVRLAAHPTESLVAVKETLIAPHREQVAAAVARENARIDALVGGPANERALAEFAAGSR